MKILWIVNMVMPAPAKALLNKKSNGLWIQPLLDDMTKRIDHQFVIVSTYKIKKTLVYEDKNAKYYILPDAYPISYNENKRTNINAWNELLMNEHPDIIQVWGTEFTHGLCALRISSRMGIPSVIHMQGIMDVIARYYLAGLSYEDIKKNITFRDRVKHDNIYNQQARYEKKAKKEAEMIRLSGHVISENTWCDTHVKAINPQIKIFKRAESLNSVFYQYKWNDTAITKYSILTGATGYPLKGLHMILKALALIIKDYPDTVLYVPGNLQVSDGSLQWEIRKNGYTKYIEGLIQKLQLENNIIWLGQLSQEDLAKQYQKCHVFVLSSVIENHSNSLKEAMTVGIPCVAAAVGGITDYAIDNENCLLYRFEEYEILAKNIQRIFESRDLARKLSCKSREKMHILHDPKKIKEQTEKIYMSMMGEHYGQE